MKGDGVTASFSSIPLLNSSKYLCPCPWPWALVLHLMSLRSKSVAGTQRCSADLLHLTSDGACFLPASLGWGLLVSPQHLLLQLQSGGARAGTWAVSAGHLPLASSLPLHHMLPESSCCLPHMPCSPSVQVFLFLLHLATHLQCQSIGLKV